MTISKQVILFSGESMGASFNSSAIDILHYKCYSASLIYTGSPVGTIKIQISNDTDSPQNWSDVDNSSLAISAAGSVTYEITDACSTFLRFVYTRTSGSGSMSGNLTAKG